MCCGGARGVGTAAARCKKLAQELTADPVAGLCLQVPRFRSTQQVLRPGVPHPIDLADFKLADKPSPPLREDDKVCFAWCVQAVCCCTACQHTQVHWGLTAALCMCLQEGHYNYELGENISSRCECLGWGDGVAMCAWARGAWRAVVWGGRHSLAVTRALGTLCGPCTSQRWGVRCEGRNL